MEESILKSTKKLVNVDPNDPSFDIDMVTHINSAFSHLHLLGLGPEAGFQITGESEKWEDFFPSEMELPAQNEVKANIGYQVRLVFDPPTLPHAVQALERVRDRSDFALQVWRESNEWVDPDPGFMVVDGGDPSGE